MNDLNQEAMKQKNELLSKMSSIILGTVSKEGLPNSSYAPSVVDSDGSMYIYISDLSKHTSNLLEVSQVSIMIIEDESNSENIFARKRFTINADALEVARDSDQWIDKMGLLEDKFGESISYLKNLTDFRLFKLSPINGLLVYGFAKAFHFVGKKLDEIKHLNEQGHTQKSN